ACGKCALQVTQLIGMQQAGLGGVAIIIIAVNLAWIIAIVCFVDRIRHVGIGNKLNTVALTDEGMRGHLEFSMSIETVIKDQRRNVDLGVEEIARARRL